MSQCVPSWDVEDPPINPSPHRLSPSSPPHPQLLPMSDYEVAELTWVNGQLSAQGLVKPTPRYPASTAGTLESVVDQANKLLHPSTVVPSNIHHPTGGPVAGTGAVDALVPTQRSLQCDDMASGIEGRKRARVGSRDSMAAHCATDNDEFGFGVSGSRDTENTSFGGGGGAATGGSKTTMDDHHSACHSRRSLSQMEASGDDDEKVIDGGTLRSTISTKRSTAAAIHNQSERKRRDKINQKMRTLQKLVPNSCKTDKASMLDEVIEYLKQLQAQVQMMSRMSSIPTHPMNMMMPMGMQQYQLTMMAQMAQIAQMGMGMGLGFMADMGSSLVRPHTGPVGAAAIPQVLQPPSAAAFLPVVGGGSAWDHPAVTAERMQPLNGGVAFMPDSFLAFLACPTQQPMTMDAYQRMAASYQQMFKQNQNSTNPK